MKPYTLAKSYDSIADEFLKLIWIWVLLVYHNHPHLSCIWMLHCITYFSMQPIAFDSWALSSHPRIFYNSINVNFLVPLPQPYTHVQYQFRVDDDFDSWCHLIGCCLVMKATDWLGHLMTPHRMLSISRNVCSMRRLMWIMHSPPPSYPEEPIYSELVFQSPPGAPGPQPSADLRVREKPPYPSPPSYKSHPCYNGMATQGPRHSDPVTSDREGSHNSSPDSGHHPHGHGDIVFYDWDAVNSRLQHRPDLSSDSDYFSTSTYRDNYRGN